MLFTISSKNNTEVWAGIWSGIETREKFRPKSWMFPFSLSAKGKKKFQIYILYFFHYFTFLEQNFFQCTSFSVVAPLGLCLFTRKGSCRSICIVLQTCSCWHHRARKTAKVIDFEAFHVENFSAFFEIAISRKRGRETWKEEEKKDRNGTNGI